jgi:hypothetical protein
MFIRRTFVFAFAASAMALAVPAHAQGRKYKAPPETSHIEVLVLKDANQKPVANAAVVFHAIMDGKDEGNLEVKTNEQGKATIDVIPTGSSVDVQVIADGFATYANTYLVSEPTRSIEVRMLKPRAQISTYVDTRGKPAQRPLGVQEPVIPSTPPVTQTIQPTHHTSDPTALAPGAVNENPTPKPTAQPGVPVQTNPPNMHPDNQYPMDPATTPKTNPATPPTAPPATPPQF